MEHRGHMGHRSITKAIDAIERRGGQPPETPADTNPFAATSDGITRTWHDSTRTFKVEAQFVKFENDKVTIRRKDGRVIALPLAKLCEEDQEFVKKQSQAVNPFE